MSNYQRERGGGKEEEQKKRTSCGYPPSSHAISHLTTCCLTGFPPPLTIDLADLKTWQANCDQPVAEVLEVAEALEVAEVLEVAVCGSEVPVFLSKLKDKYARSSVPTTTLRWRSGKRTEISGH